MFSTSTNGQQISCVGTELSDLDSYSTASGCRFGTAQPASSRIERPDSGLTSAIGLIRPGEADCVRPEWISDLRL